MRESLTLVAALLVLLLTAALVGPYVVDWNGQRALVEHRLSEVAGEPVRIHGAIDLRLLPTPYLRIEGVEAGEPDGPALLSVGSMRAELALTPLLRGEIDFVEARLEAPHLQLTLDANGAVQRSPAATPLSHDVRFERLVVDGGRIDVADTATGRRLTVTGVDFDAQAESARGPFKADGAFALGGARTPFRLSTGALDEGQLRLKLIVGQSPDLPRIDVDGVLTAPAGRPSYAGAIAFAGPIRLGSATTHWRAAGQWRGDARGLGGDAIEVRAGEDERAVAASGRVRLSFGPQPRLEAQVRARQADLDRVLTAKDQPSPLVRVGTSLGQMLRTGIPALAGRAALALSVSVDTLLLAGEPFSELQIGLDAEPDRPPFMRLDTSLPGGGRLKLDGAVETGPAAAFNGSIDASATDLERIQSWAAPLLPAASPHLSTRAAAVSGQVSLSAVGVAAHDLALTLDRTAVRGTLAVTRAVGTERARLYADVQASALDVPASADVAELARAALRDVDIEVRLAASNVRIERAGRGWSEASRLRLDLARTATRTDVRDLTLDGADGLALSAHGTADAQTATFAGRLDANRLGALAGLVTAVWPSPAVDAALARADRAMPLRLAWSAAADLPAGETPRLRALTVEGTAAGTRVTARAVPEGDGTAVNVRLEAADSVRLLQQVGVPTLPLTGTGPARVTVEAHGRFEDNLAVTASALIAGTTIDLVGHASGTQPAIGGTIRLSTADLGPLLQASAITLPDAADRLPTTLAGSIDWRSTGVAISGLSGTVDGIATTGDIQVSARGSPRVTGMIALDRLALGRLAALALGGGKPAGAGALWSSAPFGASLVDPPTARLSLRIGTLDLPIGGAARQATLRLEISPGLVRLADLDARLGAGQLAGALDLRRDGAQAALEGRLALRDVSLGLPGATATATADLAFAGTGSSAETLATSLGGNGRLRLADLVIARADADAPGRVARAIEDEQQGLDPAEVGRSLRRALDGGSLVLGDRSFDLGVAGGVLRLVPTSSAPALPSDPRISASMSVRTGVLDARIDLPARGLPATWRGAVPAIALIYKGSVLSASPLQPTVEIGDFLGVMAERAIARDSARIQLFEFDAHERAVANARLAASRRSDAGRRKDEEGSSDIGRRPSAATDGPSPEVDPPHAP